MRSARLRAVHSSARAARGKHEASAAAVTRVTALQAGLWQKSDGTWIPLSQMADPHLVNAMLKALAEHDPKALTDLLAAEVDRRHLREYALGMAAVREARERPRTKPPCDCAVVLKADGTESSFSRCTLDEFRLGELTVTSLETQDPIVTFPIGAWREAMAYGPDGYTTVAFEAGADDTQF